MKQLIGLSWSFSLPPKCLTELKEVRSSCSCCSLFRSCFCTSAEDMEDGTEFSRASGAEPTEPTVFDLHGSHGKRNHQHDLSRCFIVPNKCCEYVSIPPKPQSQNSPQMKIHTHLCRKRCCCFALTSLMSTLKRRAV